MLNFEPGQIICPGSFYVYDYLKKTLVTGEDNAFYSVYASETATIIRGMKRELFKAIWKSAQTAC